MQKRIEPVLKMDDITEIFRVSVPTVNRWLRDSRRGLSAFPLPINTPGKRLLWNKNTVEDYLEGNSQAINVPKLESPSKRKKRHREAMLVLENEHGLKIKPLRRREGINE